MIAKKQRLAAPDTVLSSGHSAKTPLFLIKTKKNELPYARWAVVISKATIKSSVQRHRVKRQVLGVAEKQLARGLDVVVVVRKDPKTMTSDSICAEIEKAVTSNNNV